MSKYQSAFSVAELLAFNGNALLKVFNDLLCYLDESRSVMYVELDLSTAFDFIDHQFLFEILANKNDLQTVVLLFIENYLSHRSQQLIINECLSGDVKIKRGVPQGWFLCPLFFLLHAAFRRQAERTGNKL